MKAKFKPRIVPDRVSPSTGNLNRTPGIETVQTVSLPANSSKLEMLTTDEQREFRECEAVIVKGWETFVEVGLALAKIRDKRLYKNSFKSFDEYYKTKWQYQKSHVYRLIAAAEIVTKLSPIGESPKPTSESQVRPLIGLTPDQAKKAWETAVDKAAGKPVTAELVREAAAPFTPVAKPKTKRTKRRESGPTLLKAVIELRRLVKEKASYEVLADKLERLEEQAKRLSRK